MDVSFTITSTLNDEQKRLWRAFCRRSMHAHPRQSPELAAVERAMGREVFFILGRRGAEACCTGVFSIRRAKLPWRPALEAIALRGPVFDDPEIGRACLIRAAEHARRLGVGRVRVSPYWVYPEAELVERMLREAGFPPCNRHDDSRQHTGLIDLAREEQAIYAGFSKSLKKQIRAARQKGVEIVPVREPARADRFYELYRHMQTTRGLPMIPPREFRAIFETAFTDEQLGIALHAQLNGELLGGLYLLRTAQAVFPSQYALAEHGDRGRLPSSISIGPMLWWEAVKWGRDAGCRVLDVEGYRPPEEESKRLRNVCAFKDRLRPGHVTIITQHGRSCNELRAVALAGLNACGRLAGEVRRGYAALRQSAA